MITVYRPSVNSEHERSFVPGTGLKCCMFCYCVAGNTECSGSCEDQSVWLCCIGHSPYGDDHIEQATVEREIRHPD